jgi:hypothetical protein
VPIKVADTGGSVLITTPAKVGLNGCVGCAMFLSAHDGLVADNRQLGGSRDSHVVLIIVVCAFSFGSFIFCERRKTHSCNLDDKIDRSWTIF